MQHCPKILFTTTLSDSQIQLAKTNSLDIDVINFVEKHPIMDQDLVNQIQKLALKKILAIFTSQSSIDNVIKNLNGTIPDWFIACTAPVTKEKAVQIFGEKKIIFQATSANDLAHQLLKSPLDFEMIVFFAGTERKDELPNIIKPLHSEKWKEIKVYSSEIKNHEISTHYDGIAFCSPSAVNAFFENNDCTDSTVLFAIGNTTAKLLQEKGYTRIKIADYPDKDKMIVDIINTFK